MAYNSFINKQVGIQSPTFRFQKDRNNGAVLAGDGLGEFQFYGFDGSNYLLTSAITSTASGTIAANRIGSNLEFYTHPDSVTASTQRMVISNVGEVIINNPDTSIPALMVTNNGTGPNINLRTANNGVNDSPHVHFTKSRAGTADVQAGDDLGRLEFRGFQGGTAIDAADILSEAETVNGASVSGALQFRTRPTTFAAIATRMTVSADGNVTIATPVSGTALTISGGGESVLGAISLNATGTANTNINGTSNSGTVNIGNTSSGAITIDCGTAGISVGTTANAHSSTFGSTNSTSATTIQSGTGALNVTSTNGSLTINSGTGTVALSNDASNTTVNLATGAAVKTVTLGSTNTTSATTVQSGTGALNVTSTNGALTINSGTGTLGLSNDASNTTVNLATGAGVKTVQLGSTNTTSSLVLRSGTGNIVANTGLTVDSTGRMTNGVQPAFHAYIGAVSVLNVTGDGTFYTVIYPTERFDVGNSYNAATGVFTAPVAGKYLFTAAVRPNEIGAAMTTGVFVYGVSGSQQGGSNTCNPANGRSVSGFADYFTFQSTLICNLAAGDTVLTQLAIFGSTKTVDITFNNADSFFAGYLLG